MSELGGSVFERFGRRFAQFKKDGETVIAVRSGVGKANAASGAAYLIAMGAERILNGGLSGAASAVRRGEIVAGESYVECGRSLIHNSEAQRLLSISYDDFSLQKKKRHDEIRNAHTIHKSGK